jgi:hypothetical protein
MSNQKKLIEDILSSYNIINENKTLVFEVTDSYNNIDFRNIGHGNPASDNINTTLLQDIQNAAKSAGVNVSVTTGISGHGNKTKSGNTSRHTTGNAVDIAMINGKAVSTSNRADADKLVAALVSMGYNKNAEGPSNPKAVLTFGFEGHDNHVHVSNMTGSPSQQQPTTSSSSTETPTNTTSTEDGTQDTETPSSSNFASKIGLSILNSMGIKESFKPGTFGVGAKIRGGRVLIPRNSNTKIKSPVSGKIVDVINNTSCVNQIIIEFEDGFLEYCGITSPSQKIKDKVGVGTVLGTTNSNVLVTLYKHNKNKTSIVFDNETSPNTDQNKGEDVGMFTSLYRGLKKSSDEKPKEPEEPKNDDSSPDDGFFLSSYKNLKKSFDRKPSKKLEENINRIKGLL